jgi:hypothetical protein
MYCLNNRPPHRRVRRTVQQPRQSNSLVSEILFFIASAILALIAGISYILDKFHDFAFAPFFPRSQHRRLANGLYARFAEACGSDTRTTKAHRHFVYWEDVVAFYVCDAFLFLGTMILACVTFIWDLVATFLRLLASPFVNRHNQEDWKSDHHITRLLFPSLNNKTTGSPANPLPQPTNNILTSTFPTNAREEYEARRRLRAALDPASSSCNFYFSQQR